jgi:hypothetical protein
MNQSKFLTNSKKWLTVKIVDKQSKLLTNSQNCWQTDKTVMNSQNCWQTDKTVDSQNCWQTDTIVASQNCWQTDKKIVDSQNCWQTDNCWQSKLLTNTKKNVDSQNCWQSKLLTNIQNCGQCRDKGNLLIVQKVRSREGRGNRGGEGRRENNNANVRDHSCNVCLALRLTTKFSLPKKCPVQLY